jgi:Flp pilus assembly protein TadG
MHMYRRHKSEGGVSTIEFTLTAATFFTMILVVIVGAHILWIHNSLVEATRRGARYAASQCNPSDTNCPGYSDVVNRVKNVVLYDNTTAGTEPIVPGLKALNVSVNYSLNTAGPGAPPTDFGVGKGTVSVKIVNYQYTAVVPVANTTITLPPYQTTVAGESAGYVAGGGCQ